MYKLSDIKMSPDYGDIVISNGNIATNNYPEDVIKDAIIERYKTSVGDIMLQPSYGANLGQFIGKGITRQLAESLVNLLNYTLTVDGLVTRSQLTISYLILNNAIHLRLTVDLGSSTISLNSTYDKEGVLKIA